jgi:hypothetical protein
MQSCNLCKWFVCMSWHDASTACWAHSRIRNTLEGYRRMHCTPVHRNQNCKARYIYYCVTTGSSFPHKTYVSPFVSLEQFFIFIWNRMDTTANIGTIQWWIMLRPWRNRWLACRFRSSWPLVHRPALNCWQNQLVCSGDVNARQSTLIYT